MRQDQVKELVLFGCFWHLLLSKSCKANNKLDLLYTAQKSDSKKSCNCPATVSLRIKKDNKDVRYRDKYARQGLLGVITIDNQHNHLLNSAEALRWRKRNDQTKEQFLDYFSSGMYIQFI
jgi:hypothetical protein